MASTVLSTGYLLMWGAILVYGIPQIQVHVSVIEEILAPNSLIKDIMDEPAIRKQLLTADRNYVHFRYLSAEPEGFSVDPSGLLRTTAWIDRDQICPNKIVCNVELDLAMQPSQYFTLVKVIISIQDINDHVPHFFRSEVSHVFSESTRIGTSFVLPEVTDPDSPQYSVKMIFLQPPTDQFQLITKSKANGKNELRLLLKSSLDRESVPEYHLQVVALDGGDPSQSGSLNITIVVADANDNHPIFDQNTYEVTLPENVPSGYSLLPVSANDLDTGLNGRIVYAWSRDTAAGHGRIFHIDSDTGVITVKGSVDYEKASIMFLTVEARDCGADPIPASALVVVHVLDVNDHAPDILVHTLGGPGVQEATVLESAATGTFVARVVVHDEDSSDNGRYNCSLDEEHFVLDVLGSDFLITTRGALDREERAEYTLAVRCWDFGIPILESVAIIHVLVGDVNDNSPRFTQTSYVAQIAENNPAKTRLIQISATDRDKGENAEIRYEIHGQESKLFTIDPDNGVIQTAVSLDREVQSIYQIRILAKDNGQTPQSVSTLLTIHVIDTNDEGPRFTNRHYVFRIYENQDPGTVVGFVEASDPDSADFAQHTYRLEADPYSPFVIDSNSGRITTTAILDREERIRYGMRIVAMDTSDPYYSSSVSVTVSVLDKNDNPPKFTFPTINNNTIYIGNNIPVGYIITKVHADDPDDGDDDERGTVNYDLIHSDPDQSYFVLDRHTGVVTVASSLQHLDNATFRLTLKAGDNGAVTMSTSATLSIVVDESFSLPMMNDPEILMSNFIIVIIVACVSAIIAVVLIVAIFIICQKRFHDNRDDRYKCPVESLKALTTDREPSENLDDKDIKKIKREPDKKRRPVARLSLSDRLEQDGRGHVTATFVVSLEHMVHLSSAENVWYICRQLRAYGISVIS
ncbi:hypothetical protein LSH36_12g06012 [Paralvinella palmiformis]|uniref:Protocadherin-20 n=1 Tax=Paralvinella palmiformis TaxID=53620 RepID=A0AAD9KCE0_9ANNE|nr:hypothetical protein LSH36_12g06012 [Paralvinella palmiformis]